MTARHTKYLCAVLLKIGYPQKGPTPLYKDSMLVINMINNCVPIEQFCHSDIQYFTIQDWADAKDIIMQHIPYIVCMPDGLTKPLSCLLHFCYDKLLSQRAVCVHYLDAKTVSLRFWKCYNAKPKHLQKTSNQFFTVCGLYCLKRQESRNDDRLAKVQINNHSVSVNNK